MEQVEVKMKRRLELSFQHRRNMNEISLLNILKEYTY